MKVIACREGKLICCDESSKKDENLVKVVICREGEPICCDESSDSDGPFYFFYTTFFTKVLLRLPLSIFEKELLNKLKVAPVQLHPKKLGVYPRFCHVVFLARHFIDSGSILLFFLV